MEVRSAAEIAATLDESGRHEGLPFMPEMTAYCGRRLKVYRRAEKTCVEGAGLRRMDGVVLLEGARCDGSAHDGCQRGCLMFWKEAWLKPAPAPERRATPREVSGPPSERLRSIPARQENLYTCQSTQLAAATAPMSKWNLGHLLADVRRGELSLLGMARIVGLTLINRVRRQFGRPELWVITGPGADARGGQGLQPGEWVRVRSAEEIRATLDARGRNFGLSFEPEMSLHLGRTFRVGQRVERIIHEETGRMVRLRDTVALEGLVCRGVCVKNCPRSNPLYWRESWLERVAAPAGPELRA
ncbi:MAG: hypothetical protein ABW042_12130 [Phenylobacterium sp.]